MSAQQYFQSYNNYFWQWEDQAEVIGIPGSDTIAYRAFLGEVVQHLGKQGLPPFGSLILAMIATKPNGAKNIAELESLAEGTLDASLKGELQRAIVFLNLLSEVPLAYKEGRKRILLFQALFENCHQIIAIKRSSQIVDDLLSGRVFDTYLSGAQSSRIKRITLKQDIPVAVCRDELRAVSLLGNKFKTVENIIQKVAGLKDLPEDLELEEELVAEGETNDFTEQLIRHDKTFHVGALIKSIWGGLHIPARSFMPSTQSLGGVADLTNKGDFDKLLISEFANEDLVFLSRIANNESLYIRRETPPESNDLERIILLDTSLKNWGTPKTLAFSLAVAIARHPKTKISCSVYALGESYEQVYIETVDQVIDAMQLVDPNLNAALGLTAYFKDHPGTKNKEIFLITTADSLKQPAMLRAMNDYQSMIHYWIYTDATGSIDFYKKQQNSKKHLQHLQLPLAELWKRKASTVKAANKNSLAADTYPILFRSTSTAIHTLCAPDGEVFLINKEKCLMRYHDKYATDRTKGWQVVHDNLPFYSGDFEIGLSSAGDYILLMYNANTKKLLLLNLQTKETKNVFYDSWKPGSNSVFVFSKDEFYHQTGTQTNIILIDGTVKLHQKAMAVITSGLVEDKKTKERKVAYLSAGVTSVLKNAYQVFINQTGNLVINKHELHLNKGYHIKLDAKQMTEPSIHASKMSDKEFVFPDGSSLEINRNGMFILRSSDQKIPSVFVPASLDVALGIATPTEFAGNEYYFKSVLYEVQLKNAGKNRLAVTKVIAKIANCGIEKAKELADNAPSVIYKAVTIQKAEEIKKAIAEEVQDAEVEWTLTTLWNTQSKEMTRIDNGAFFKKYITPFITTIQGYGATH